MTRSRGELAQCFAEELARLTKEHGSTPVLTTLRFDQSEIAIIIAAIEDAPLVDVIDVRAGDTVIFKFKRRLSADTYEKIHAYARDKLPTDVHALIADDTFSGMTVLRAETPQGKT